MFESIESFSDFAAERCRVYKYADCDSTNEEAARLVSSGSCPVIVVAQHQRKGRGRRGKQWMGESGKNMYLSIALPQPRWTDYYTDYQLLACMAVLKVMRAHLPADTTTLKYPNDILVQHNGVKRKLAGILVEAEFRAMKMMSCVCGIGLNVNQRNTRIDEPATHSTHTQLEAVSMIDVLNIETDIESITTQIITRFFEQLQRSADEVFADWVQELDLVNKRVRINDSLDYMVVLEVQRDGSIRVSDEHKREVRTVDQNNSFRMQVYE